MIGWLIFGAGVLALIWFNPVGRRRTPSPPPVVVTADAGVPLVRDAGVPVPVATDAANDAPDAPPDAMPDPTVDAAPPADPLYTITEALDDIAASPLVYMGTGAWPGTFSIKACAYHNKHVLVVYDYCTGREQPALGLHVISPTRGSLHIYVEADKGISTLVRADYMTFKIEGYPQTEPPPRLDFTYDEVSAWYERRYNAHDGACWVTVGDTSCSSEVVDRLDAWSPSAEAFIADPGTRWYELVKAVRTRTLRDLRGTK